MVVGDGERPAAPGEHGLQDVGRLDGAFVHAAVAHEHDLQRTRRPVGDHHDEALAVTVQQLGPDDLRDGRVIDQARPGG